MATSRQASTAVRLRQGGIDDLDDVMNVMNAAFSPCFGEAWTRSQCAGILPMHGVSLTIAEDDSDPIGFSLARTVTDESELLLLAVDPARQRSGIGRALLEQFVAQARTAGSTRFHLEVRDGNAAVGLYRTAGFLPAGRRRKYYHGPEGETYDAVTLMLTD